MTHGSRNAERMVESHGAFHDDPPLQGRPVITVVSIVEPRTEQPTGLDLGCCVAALPGSPNRMSRLERGRFVCPSQAEVLLKLQKGRNTETTSSMSCPSPHLS